MAATTRGVTLSNANGEDISVPIVFPNEKLAERSDCIISSRPFVNWITAYKDHPELTLTSVEITNANFHEDTVDTLVVVPTVSSKQRPSPVRAAEHLLVSESVLCGVLVILRHSQNSSGPGRDSYSRTWTRDYVLFEENCRPAVADHSSLEILTGTFDESGVFTGPASALLESTINTTILKSDVVPLNSKRDGVNGVYLDPRRGNRLMNLYLYRRNITQQEVALFPRIGQYPAADGPDSANPLRLISLGEAWKVARDAATMAALFLFYEFRYHGLMPKYRAPSDIKAPLSLEEKRKPQFSLVDELNPSSAGVNLRVKIQALSTKQEAAKTDPKQKEANLVVADSSGMINMRVDGAQFQGDDEWSEGTCLCIRNGKIQMVDHFMVLNVDKWGKLTVESNANDEFQFDINTENNKSEVEYELVREGNENAGTGGRKFSDGPRRARARNRRRPNEIYT